MRNLTRLAAAAICGLFATAASAATLRVLFVGNSYTYVNDLPALVAAMGATQGVTVQVTMRAEPDYSLADHLRDRRLRVLLSLPWDWVVLQQGPSSLPASRAELIESTRELAQRLRRAQEWRRRQALGLGPMGGVPPSASARVSGPPSEALRGPARIALFAAWPQLPYADSSPAAEESYRLAARSVRACVLPVAAAWRLARTSGEAPRLYRPDAIHPTGPGTILAALTIVTGLLGLDAPPSLLAEENADPVEQPRLKALEEAARRALAEEPLRCGA
jgi:hypothetical protein